MAHSYGSRIVTDGLVFYLDAANPNSYVSGSLVWNNLVPQGRGITASLVNNPGFGFNNDGVIKFDGSNDYVTTNEWFYPGNNDSFSWEVWANIVSGQNAVAYGSMELAGVFGSGFFGNWSGFGIAYGRTLTSQSYFIAQVQANDSTVIYASSSFITIGNWYHICAVMSRNNTLAVYLNGVPQEITSSLLIGNQYVSADLFYPATHIISDNGANTWRFSGSISSAKVYNRVLSSQEVLQNFNALKGRFNL